MGDKFKNLIKTAGEENLEAEEQYQELLKVGNVIGLGFMDVVMDKEGKWKGVGAAVGAAGKGLKKGKKYIGGKLKAGYKSTKKGVGKGYEYGKGKAVAGGKAVGRGAKKVDKGVQRVGGGIAAGGRYIAKGTKSGPKKALSVGKKRALGYGAIGTSGGAAGYAVHKKKASDDTAKTAADFIVRYSEEGEE